MPDNFIPCVRNKCCLVLYPNATSNQIFAFDRPCLLYMVPGFCFLRFGLLWSSCKSKAACNIGREQVEVRILKSCGCTQTAGLVKRYISRPITSSSMPRNTFPWSTYSCIRVLVPIPYLKPWNNMYICTYIYIYMKISM